MGLTQISSSATMMATEMYNKLKNEKKEKDKRQRKYNYDVFAIDNGSIQLH